jgi:4-hydroxybenzoate polyprenyltransferase
MSKNATLLDKPQAKLGDENLSPREKPNWFTTLALLFWAMRPKQWTKNLIAFAPLLFAGKLGQPELILATSFCVLAFCLVSGGLYVFNDLLDRENDRVHPTKCLRPIASGRLDHGVAFAFAIFAVVAGLTICFAVRPSLSLIALLYMSCTLSYSLYLKHSAILDVFMIATGFVLRAIAGAMAICVPISGWFLLCTSLGALYLALEKRRKEILMLGADSHQHRKVLSNYSIASLDRMESIVVPSLVTSYMFYSFLSSHGEWMLLTVPPVIYGIMRYQMLSDHASLTASPEEVLWKDRPIQVAIVAWLTVSALVVYGIDKSVPLLLKSFDGAFPL